MVKQYMSALMGAKQSLAQPTASSGLKVPQSSPSGLLSARNSGGGGDDPKTAAAPLSKQEMQEWNSFIKFVKSKGVAGSKDLDKRDKDRGKELFDEFKKLNPGTSINYDIVPRAQAEFLRFQKFHKDFKSRKGADSSDQFDRLSPQDGWFGSITSQQELVPMVVQTVNQDGQTVAVENKGLINGDGGVGAARPAPRMMKDGKPYVAGGKQPIKLEDGWYVDDDSGYLVPVEQYNKIKGVR